MKSKEEIRKRVLELRGALNEEEVRSKSTALFERIYTLRQYREAEIVMAYMDFRNEVMTGGFIRQCQLDGKKVALPKVEIVDTGGGDPETRADVFTGSGHTTTVRANTFPEPGLTITASSSVIPGKGRSLAIYMINDVAKDTIPGHMGIIEPNSALLKRLDPSVIDLAIIPGVAFDYERNRIGYGAGYYDRFLLKLRADCLKAGVAFGVQLVDEIPAGLHDVPVDIVVTEDVIVR